MNSNIYRCKFLFIFFVCVTLLSYGEKIIYNKLWRNGQKGCFKVA